MEEQREEKEENFKLSKETKYFVLITVIALAVVLFVLISWSKSQPLFETVEYNYFTFKKIGGLWQTELELDNQLYEAVFRFNPKQVETVPVSGQFTGFNATPVYITFDPNTKKEQFSYLALATSEITLNLIRALNQTVEAACTKNETDVCIERPIVTCDDTEKSVIYLKAEGDAGIQLNNHCVTLTGENFELLRSSDRLLYQWYHIME